MIPTAVSFFWRVSRGNAQKGSRAGSIDGEGYRVIGLDGRLYKASRLAWLYIHGTWPPAEIDHANGSKADNRLSNLRLSTHSQNQANIGPRKNNASGLKGVSWSKAARKWIAQISFHSEVIYLGSFVSPEEAHAAYFAKARELYGEFAKAR